MKDIIKIVITSSSGYCPVDEAFDDRLSITSDSISYKYVPMMESDINPMRIWKYNTNSPIFKKQFEVIVSLMNDIIKRKQDMFYTDIGSIKFNITYSDKTKFSKIFYLPADDFEKQFKEIKKLVPATEYIPIVLMTSEDYEEIDEL